jgi:hypothetical protein
MGKIATSFVLTAIIMCLAFPLQAPAFMIDGTKPIICSFSSAFACDSIMGCERTLAEDLNLPRFFKVDFKNSKIIGLGAGVQGGAKKETPIKSIQHVDNLLVLQGVEIRAWSMAITDDTGKMVLTGSGDDEGFALFGDCMVPE